MNKNIKLYNDGKQHQPILKVRVFEQGSKFQVGQNGNKSKKYVEAAKGTNLFFAIYQDKEGKRNYATIPLNEVIESQKQGLNSVPETNEKGYQLVMTLSPNDLVYVPSVEETVDMQNLNLYNIYKVVSFSTYQCFFIQNNVSTSIVNKVEFSALNKSERSINGVMIKDTCLKLKVDRLGNIIK